MLNGEASLLTQAKYTKINPGILQCCLATVYNSRTVDCIARVIYEAFVKISFFQLN